MPSTFNSTIRYDTNKNGEISGYWIVNNIIAIHKKDIEYYKLSGEILHNISGGGSNLK